MNAILLGAGVLVVLLLAAARPATKKSTETDETTDNAELPSLHDLVAEACGKTGYLDPAAAAWIAPIIDANQNLGIDEIARRVRGKATGTGDLYLQALTERGCDDEVKAAQIVVHMALMTLGRAEKMAQYRKNPRWPLRFSAIEDDHTCARAKAMNDRIFSQADAPALPLPNCNAEVCRCIYIAEPEGPPPKRRRKPGH